MVIQSNDESNQLNNKSQLVNNLSQALKIHNYKTAYNILHEIAKVKDMSAIPTIIEALNYPDEGSGVRFAAAETLGLLGNVHAVPALVEEIRRNSQDWFYEEEGEFFEATVVALSNLGKPGLIALVRLLNEKQEGLRYWVEYALDSKQRDYKVFNDGSQKLNKEQLTNFFIDNINHKDADVRKGIAKVIGRLENLEIVKPLVILLDSEPNLEVELEIIETLGKLGNESATNILVKFLQTHKDSRVRQFAARALGKIGGNMATQALLNALNDIDVGVRTNVVAAIGQLDTTDVILPLVKTLTDENSKVRLQAVKTLGHLAEKQPQAVAAWAELLEIKRNNIPEDRKIKQEIDKIIRNLSEKSDSPKGNKSTS